MAEEERDDLEPFRKVTSLAFRQELGAKFEQFKVEHAGGRGLRGLGATMRFVEWLLAKRLLVLGVAATLCVAGGIAWKRLPIDAL